MTAPPWGHKPPHVGYSAHFCYSPPPQLSERCRYWLRRADEGNWRANRHFWKQGLIGRAHLLGVRGWEIDNLIVPFLANLKAAPGAHCARALGHDVANCCGSCHAGWESEGTPMCDGYDVRGKDLHACCKAAITSTSARELMPWHARVEARR